MVDCTYCRNKGIAKEAHVYLCLDCHKDIMDELIENLEEAFMQGASYVSDKNEKRFGWWCSNAMSSVRSTGDRLVEIGKWERHPDGYGRLWFYRPIKNASVDHQKILLCDGHNVESVKIEITCEDELMHDDEVDLE